MMIQKQNYLLCQEGKCLIVLVTCLLLIKKFSILFNFLHVYTFS